MTVPVATPIPPSTHQPGWQVPFHVADIDDGDIAAVVDVLRSGWLTTGERTREFELAFAQYLGGDLHAVAVNSGTAALHLALDAVGVGPGQLVLTTPYTFTATAEVIRHLGADPVFVDVDPARGNMTPGTVLAAFAALAPQDRDRVSALLPVHFAGRACAMKELAAMCQTFGWSLVDDAAHALPSASAGRAIGTCADVTAFSFYATKTLCTGEGGMVVTRDDGLAQRMRIMRLHGIDRDAFDRYRRADSWYYEVVAAGYKYNLPDTAAALGLAQLRKLERHRARREWIASRYTRAFVNTCGVSPPDPLPIADVHAWHLYPLRVHGGAAVRNALIRELASRGIGSSVHFIPLHLQPYYRKRYGLGEDDFPGASRLYAQEISLPIYPTMTDRQVDLVIDSVRRALPIAAETAVD